MPVYRLGKQLAFPPPDHAEESGLLAVGGDLKPERLLLAYSLGIFPWYHEGIPILWYSPDPRTVLEPSALVVSRSLRKAIRRAPYRITLDTAFGKVIRACATAPRPGQDGTWITAEMRAAYVALHRLGHAHSVEVRAGDRLVGGIYGVAIGRMFFGESMFSAESGASKAALAALARRLHARGWPLIDAQVENPHLRSLGARRMPRAAFVAEVARLAAWPEPPGLWRDPPLPAAGLADGTAA